jgi:hypothetical protein
MASSGKKKTTMGKLNRERRLRERRIDKQAKKDARKLAAENPVEPSDTLTDEDALIDGDAEVTEPGAAEPAGVLGDA